MKKNDIIYQLITCLIQIKVSIKHLMNILREKLNEKMYGYPFMEIEVLKNNNREYLLYDPDESRFVKDTIACIPDAVGWPH